MKVSSDLKTRGRQIAVSDGLTQLRKIMKTRGHFPTDEAAIKLLWLAMRNITAR